MLIGTAYYELFLYTPQSLKEKRALLKSLLERMRQRFNISAAEIDYQDLWQRALLGVAIISNDAAHIDKILDSVTRFIENFSDEVELTTVKKELY